ncbi:uncharacterized protein LOC126678113 [Mercurialis annua]|uniref:uncharacterized protein LOC126678113 n=1 Tax=Mercurialis annua TaxID=3986 RepID=UPI00215E6130|nr:uncharacterized protein LOC126678113 [Mercurialis annua]XP_050228953.1 uncharacterized protein LOC126678113 [Mercurialis annua]
MNSISMPSSLVLQLPSRHLSCHRQLHSHYISNRTVACHVRLVSSLSSSFLSNSCCSLHTRQSSIGAAVPSNDEGPVSVINFEEFAEKDWSFLDLEDSNSVQHKQNLGRIISAGEIGETSRVLVLIGSEEFVDQLVDTSPASPLHVIHDSLFVLAITKEKYDKVKCWHGELIHMPAKWAPLDVVFLYFLPALPFKLDQVLGTLAQHCSQGARVVISHPQGREALEQQRKQYKDVIVSELPDKMTLQNAASNNSFEITEYVDEPGFYLAVLRFSRARN